MAQSCGNRGIQSKQDLHSRAGRRLIIQRKSLEGGSPRRARLTRSCPTIALLVNTNAVDGNSSFPPHLFVDTHTYSNGKFLAGIGLVGGWAPARGGVVTMTRYVHECSELIVEREIPEEQNRKRTEHSL